MASGFILTPNMFLPVPTVGVEPGPLYANDVNGSLTILDGHSHVAGSGVLITPAAININTNLTMQNHSLIGIQSLTLTPQIVTPPIDSVYVKGVDLHYVDGNGVDIPITTGGLVAAVSFGITNGLATAAFVGDVLVVNHAPNTTAPANIQAGSYLMGNNTAGTFFITLQPQLALAASYTLTLPLLPGVSSPIQNIMTLDTAGNMGTESFNTAATTGTATGFNTIANGRTRATGLSTEGVGGVAISLGSGSFSTTSLSYVTPTNLSVTLTTSGRPIFVGLIIDPASVSGGFVANVTTNANTQFLNNGVSLGIMTVGSGATNTDFPPSAFNTIDIKVGGTYIYQFQVSIASGGGTVAVRDCKLIAYEL